ncbi:MAG: type transport system ATP-binding protein [Gaiellaceae bacterium]|nr:type transport system ATP-binding protein [Gaiellaceae bacterium]
MGRTSVLCATILATLAWSSTALAVAPQQLTIPMSDGVQLACSLVEPDGAPPAGGWPALMLFHGLGGTHEQLLEPLAVQFLAPAGYATLECDARGHGLSGGLFGLDGPRDVQDTRELFTWLTARPEISDTRIGAYGYSLGGGAVWNAAAAGVPFKAIAPSITWTNLKTALQPQLLAKSGIVQYLALLVPPARWDPELLAAKDALTTSEGSSAVTALAASRSVASKLATITTPTFLMQGRHDFLFDVDQALAAYKALRGPKRLYIGDLGHLPATNPFAEEVTLAGELVKWFDRYVRGIPNGIQSQPPVELAHDPWDGKTASYKTLPATKTISVALPGTATISGASGKVVRSVRVTGGPHETFGDSSVTVSYSGAQSWDHLVAVLTIAGDTTPISLGGIKFAAASGTLTINLMNEVVRIPPGKRLTLYLSSTSLAQDPSDALYVTPAQTGAQITIGRATLHLSVLARAIAR